MTIRNSATKILEEFLNESDPKNIEIVLDLLERAWSARRLKINNQWNRTLPLTEYIVDRWKKANLLGFGEGTSIYDSALVFGDVTVGKNTFVGPHVILDGTGGLSIGSNCSISAGVQIYSHDSVKWAISGGNALYEYAPTKIGDNCYIGPNTVISKGICIGDRCIIGANSLVLKDIPQNSRAYGTPCKIRNSLND